MDANEPAYPIAFDPGDGSQVFGGLTKRELFASMAMQTFMQGAVLPQGFDASEQLQLAANRACEVADALLAELAKEPGA